MKKKVLLIILIIAVSIPGCNGKQLPSSSPSPSSSNSFTPTPIATASVPISTSTGTTSPTTVPTLSPEQAQETILDWLENNGNCRLPCIWNLEPGITTTLMRKNLLMPFTRAETENFGIYPTSNEKNPGGIGYSFQSDDTHQLSISLHYYEEDGYISYLNLLTDVSNSYIRIFDDADYKRLTQYYSLSQILTNYGPPSDIYLATWPYDPFAKSDYEPFILVLIYTEVGFRVEYIFEAKKLDDQIIGCPTESVLTITTWRPKANMSLEEIASIGIGYEFNEISFVHFRPIEDVTSINAEDFYQSYGIENKKDCITTPAEIWNSDVP